MQTTPERRHHEASNDGNSNRRATFPPRNGLDGSSKDHFPDPKRTRSDQTRTVERHRDQILGHSFGVDSGVPIRSAGEALAAGFTHVQILLVGVLEAGRDCLHRAKDGAAQCRPLRRGAATRQAFTEIAIEEPLSPSRNGLDGSSSSRLILSDVTSAL